MKRWVLKSPKGWCHVEKLPQRLRDLPLPCKFDCSLQPLSIRNLNKRRKGITARKYFAVELWLEKRDGELEIQRFPRAV